MKNWTFSALRALVLLCIFPAIAQAEVIARGENGFNLVIEAQTAASPLDAYNQFVRIDEWWDANHSYFGQARNFSLDPRAGGCFCEKSGTSEVLHMLVTYVKPGEEVRMVGGLGPLQMMGLSGGMSWRFVPLPSGGTKIIQTYNVSGFLPGGADQIADVVNTVQTGQQSALIKALATN